MKRFLFLAAVLGGLTSQASAAFLSNGSFETHTATANVTSPPGFKQLGTVGAGATAITDWTIVTGNIDYVKTLWPAADATYSLDLNGSTPGAIQQTIGTAGGSTPLTIGGHYSLTFSMAANPGGGAFGVNNPSTKTVQVSIGALTQNFAFDILTNNPTRTMSNIGWVTKTFNFVATSATPLLKFASISSPGSAGPTIDNVQITPVPLPASLALLLAGVPGFVGMGWVLRRKEDSQPQA